MEDANDNNNWLRKTTEGASKYGMEIYNVKKYKIVFFFMCDEQKAFRYFPFDLYVAQASLEWLRVDLTRPRLKNSVPKYYFRAKCIDTQIKCFFFRKLGHKITISQLGKTVA